MKKTTALNKAGGRHVRAASKCTCCNGCGKPSAQCICGAPVSAAHTIKKIYTLENLDCANCAAKMEKKIHALPQVSDATITFATKQLSISAADPDALLPSIRRICTSIESGVRIIDPENSDPTAAAKPSGEDGGQKKELFSLITGALLFAAGMAVKASFPNTSLILFVISYVILGGEIILTALKNIVKGHVFDENFLMSIATLGAFAIREYPEAVGVMLFFRIGEFFEECAVSKSRKQIMEAVDMRPETVTLLSGNEVKDIPARQASIGDTLLVRPGGRIPLDGTVLEGESRIDTSPVTGEPVPISVSPGSELLSGCINTSGVLKLRVEKELKDSMVTRILDSVENAAASKPKIDRFITRFARIYTPFVVLLAAATAILPSLFTGNWDYWIYTALSFLVISCPCALVLSVPLAFFSGIGAGSKQGILFKGGSAIEAISKVRAVVMDKTGTVTKGDFTVQQILPFGKYSKETLLRLAASCELNSTHPIGASIVAAQKEKGETAPQPDSVEEIAGMGIRAVLPEGTVLCGNQKLMNKYEVAQPGFDSSILSDTATVVYLAVNNRLAGVITISDTIKDDAAQAVNTLKKNRIVTAMLTGDSQETASSVSSRLGIDLVFAKLLPEDKLRKLKDIRANYGAVMFVGDGINDAPVLAGADVGAAMGSGADAAIEAADIVFMTSSMDAIPESIRLSRATNRIAMQNVIFALTVKALVMVLGLLGFASMWMAVFADSGVAMLCVLNSIRILHQKNTSR